MEPMISASPDVSFGSDSMTANLALADDKARIVPVSVKNLKGRLTVSHLTAVEKD